MSTFIDNAATNPFKNPTPLATGSVGAPDDLKGVSYTAFDFYSIKERVIDYARKHFGENFNDFVEADLGIMLIELWAYMADLISFKVDMNVNEVFIGTVSQKKNLHRIAKLVGYPVRSPRPATTRCSLSVASPYSFDVSIAPGFVVNIASKDNYPLNFQLYAADESWNPLFEDKIVIPAGSSSNLSVIAIEGNEASLKKTSDGSRFQGFQTVYEDVFDGSIAVTVNGLAWTQVDFFDESDNGFYYTVEKDENHKATVRFGDDVRGRIPPEGATVLISYRYGGGERGNIDVNYIQQIVNVTSDDIPGSIPLAVTNYTRGEGGADAETINEVRYKLPKWVKAQDRGVNAEDYAVLAETFSTLYHGRIGKALAALRNSGCSGNVIDVYVLQTDSTTTFKTANRLLKEELAAHLDAKGMLTDFICVKDAGQVFLDMNINATISKFDAASKKDIYEKIKAGVNDFFAPEKRGIGQSLSAVDLTRALNRVQGVSSISVSFASNKQNLAPTTDSVLVDFWKIIRPGNVNIHMESV